jgi:hypothetical protein
VRKLQRGGDARDALPAAPRKSGPEERNVLQLAKSLIEHPHHAARISLEELVALVSDPMLASLVRALVEVAGEGGSLDVERVAERLDAEAGHRLRALAAEAALDEERAVRIIDDTMSWLRRRHQREEHRALTARLRDPDADPEELLAAKAKRIKKGNDDTHPPMGSQP